MKYYFTYSNDGNQPYIGGWTEVEAGNMEQAIAIFDTIHPRKTDFINCAGIYNDSFERTPTYTNGNFGAKCHERIGITVEKA